MTNRIRQGRWRDSGPPRSAFAFAGSPRPVGTPAARIRRGNAGQPALSGLLVAAGIIIAALTAVVIAQAVQLSGHPARVPTTAGIQPVDGGFGDVNFPLKGTRGANLQAQYLRVGHEPSFIWLALAAAGLPRGYDYIAWVGECVRGRPRTLTGYSAIPDDRTGIWLVSGLRVPGGPGTILWVTVTRAGDARPLGGIRGNFLLFGRQVAIAPGHPVCS